MRWHDGQIGSRWPSLNRLKGQDVASSPRAPSLPLFHPRRHRWRRCVLTGSSLIGQNPPTRLRPSDLMVSKGRFSNPGFRIFPAVENRLELTRARKERDSWTPAPATQFLPRRREDADGAINRTAEMIADLAKPTAKTN